MPWRLGRWAKSEYSRAQQHKCRLVHEVISGHLPPGSGLHAVLSSPRTSVLQLPGNLLVPTAYLSVTCGSVQVPVINIGKQDQWLWLKTMLEELHMAILPAANLSIHFEHQQAHGKQVIFIQSVESEGNDGVEISLTGLPCQTKTSRMLKPCLMMPQCNNSTTFPPLQYDLSRSMSRSY